MRRIAFFSLLTAALFALRQAEAQEPETPDPFSGRPGSEVSWSQMAPTPQMWLYQQERLRETDPKEIIRRKAQYKAEQRRERLAARRWFGYSNMRPMVSPTPHVGTYSPTWVGNSYVPYQWRGERAGQVVHPRTAGRGFFGLY